MKFFPQLFGRRATASADMGGYRVDQVFFRKRLGQVLFGPNDSSSRAIKNAVFAGQHDDWSGFEILIILDQCTSLIAVQSWHHDIDENDVRLVLGYFGQGFESIDRRHHLTADFLKQSFSAAANRFTVIDHHDLDVHTARLRRRIC